MAKKSAPKVKSEKPKSPAAKPAAKKVAKKAVVAAETAPEQSVDSSPRAATSGRYIETIGRRKTSVARVRMTPSGKSSFAINGKSLQDYLKLPEYVRVAQEALEKLENVKNYTITVVVKGGGLHAQAQAIRHGIARGLVAEQEDYKKDLRKFGFIKRDPRSKERRKFGLKKARKAPQWSKR